MPQLAKLSHRGGGGNPLTSDDDDSYPQENDDKDDENNTENEEITYTYKTYYDYFIDNMDCTGVYDTDGNLTNVTISAEKKAEILSTDFTGTGTSTDPYQVNSSLGFWYMSKFVTLTNCYVELNCDVILNDETFDENGNASGGDGVVYSWLPIAGAVDASIYGNNNTIFGLYFNDESQDEFAIFKANINSIQDLTVAEVFINGNNYITTICFSYTKPNITNCHVKNGTIKANSDVCGVAYSGVFKNSSNSINLFVKGSAGGITIYHSPLYDCVNYGNITYSRSDNEREYDYIAGIAEIGECYNCKNFGDILGNENTWLTGVGGIAGYPNGKIVGCENYGKIVAQQGWGGGILGYCYGKTGEITDCKNYGECFNACGIAGFGHAIKITNCDNYGNVTNGSGICGAMNQGEENHREANYIIKNCNVYCNLIFATESVYFGIFGGGHGPQNVFEITNCTFTGEIIGTPHYCFGLSGIMTEKNYEQIKIYENITVNAEFETTNNVRLFFVIPNNNTIVMKNCNLNYSGKISNFLLTQEKLSGNFEMSNSKININSKDSNYAFRFFNQNTTKTIFKNLIIDNICEVTSDNLKIYSDNNLATIDGVIVTYKTLTQDEKIYYGSSFRDFYVSWRTGKIGLKALDGVGYFQGAIDEEWLGNNGYVKKG